MSFSDLPYIETRYQEHECCPSCQCANAHKEDDETKVRPDSRLKKWEDWMKERSSVHQKLVKSVDRHTPAELLMNTCEDRRDIEEKKMAIEYSKIPGPLDYYRGSPAFWKLPTALNKKSCESQTYYTVMTKKEKFEIPEIEYVKIPDVIKTEKEAVSNRKFHDINKSQYFQHLYKSEDVKRIEPYHPQSSKLVVVGQSLQKAVEEEQELTNIVYRLPILKEEVPQRSNLCLLALNGLELYRNSTGVRKVTIFMDGMLCGEVETGYLRIQNKQMFSLRYYFKKQVEVKQFAKLTNTDCSEQPFYYNKNVHLIEPYKEIDFPFWLKMYICRPIIETLEMVISPDLWSGALKILIVLQATASKLDAHECYNEITEMLENQIRERIIAETLEDALRKIPQERAETKLFTYDKAMIFEAVNSVYDPMRLLPKYLYDKRVVDELEQFYEDVKLEIHPQCWDYRLETLRVVTKDHIIADEEKRLQKQLDELRGKVDVCEVKRAELDAKVEALWASGNKKGKEGKEKKGKKDKPKKDKGKKDKKSKSGKDKVIRMVEPKRDPLPRTLLDDLQDIIAKLTTPMTWKFQHLYRIKLCYSLFCAYIDNITSQVTEFEKIFEIERLLPKERKKVHEGKERIYDERPAQTVMECSRFREFSGSPTDGKAPEWTSQIPIEEYEQRYNAFHGITAKKGKDKKGKKDKGAKKSKGSSKKSKEVGSGKTQKTGDAETIVTNVDEEESIPDDDTQIPTNFYDHYNNNVYLIFRDNLLKLVDDVIGAFELIPGPQIPPQVLNSFQNSNYNKMQIDNDTEVRVFDLKRAISELLRGGETDVEERVTTKLEVFIKPDIKESCPSVWELLQAYHPTKERATPLKEGDIYAITRKPDVLEMMDGVTSIVPEEPTLVKNLQTDVCGSERVFFTDKSVEEVSVCECKDLEESETIFSHYDSRMTFSNVTSQSSDEEYSCKEN